MNKSLSSKYHPLTAHLRAQGADKTPMTFGEIERVIGGKLPPSACSSRAWWSNNPSNNVMTKAWLEAGFESEQVDLAGKKLVFRRAAPVGAGSRSEAGSSDKLALFGWMRGTVATIGDPTEPADSEWARRLDDEYPPVA